MNIDLKSLTIEKAHVHLVAGDFSAMDLLEAYIAEIEKKNPDINAYVGDLFLEQAREQAEYADTLIKEGRADVLTGIPIALKDNILIKGEFATGASNILTGHRAVYDSTVVAKLREKGVVFVGRTNMDDAAMGSSTQTSPYGPTKNPLDTTKVPGGSSGGSAAVVASDLAVASFGSDTAGSVRQPSSFCGVVGLKPTYGSVSRSGLIALGSSLDVIGPITKTVTDAEILFNAIKGKDILDSTTVDDKDYPKNEYKEEKPVIGYVDLMELIDLDTDNAVSVDTPRFNALKQNYEESIEKLKGLGYTLKKVDFPNIKYSVPAYYIVLPAEASTNLARYDSVRYGFHKEGEDLLQTYKLTRGQGFGEEVRRRIILGTYVLSAGYYDAYYNKAQAIRKRITEDFDKAFSSVDAVVMPTTPGSAFNLGEKMDDPVAMYLEDVFTVPSNLVGIPTISIPSNRKDGEGFEGGLPLGLQILAPHMREDTIFSIGKEFLGEK